jgi:outer membrane receptor protein involved in Fe transport
MKCRKRNAQRRLRILTGVGAMALSVAHAQTPTPAPQPEPTEQAQLVAPAALPDAPAEPVAAPALVASVASAPAAADKMQTITVTGSRVNVNGNDSPTPVTVLTMQDLQAAHPTTVFEALLDDPVFAGSRGATSSQPASAGGSNGPNNNQISALNLRGLGPIRTLILYDGHRVSATQQNGLVDANTIPQMLLKRVDIVTGGASAVYGSDAIGGVVNFITDRNFNGVKLEVQGGQSERGFDKTRKFGIAAGKRIFDGRGHIEGSIQNFHDAGVLHRNDMGSPFSDRWTIQGAGTAASPFFLAPQATNQSATFGGKITNAAGQPANPLANYQFASNGVLAPMNQGSAAGTTGDLRIGGDGYYHTGATLKPQADLSQVYGRFDFDVTDDLHFYATAAGTLDHSLNYNTNNQIQNFKISSSNAYLAPAYQQQMQAAGVSFFNFSEVFGPDSNIPVQSFDFYTRSKYFNTGLEGSLGDYKWETSYSHSDVTLDAQNNFTTNYGRLYAAMDAVKDASGNIVCNVSLTNPGLYPGCVPINMFGPSAVTQAAANYVRNQSEFLMKMPTNDLSGSITGAPFENWAGPVNTALSGEWRRQAYSLTTNAPPADYAPLDCTGIRFGNCVKPTASSVGSPQYNLAVAPRPSVSMTVKEIALESDVPLLKNAPLAKSANLNLAYRYAKYSAEGNTDVTAPSNTYTFNSKTWKAGVDWHFNEAVTVRAARSHDLRAPNLNDLFSPKTTTFSGGFVDRWTGTNFTSNGSLPATESSGNPNLRPEVATTNTLGIVLAPSSQFSIAVDAFDIKIKDFITRVAGSDAAIQDACYAGATEFCALQVRFDVGTRDHSFGVQLFQVVGGIAQFPGVAIQVTDRNLRVVVDVLLDVALRQTFACQDFRHPRADDQQGEILALLDASVRPAGAGAAEDFHEAVEVFDGGVAGGVDGDGGAHDTLHRHDVLAALESLVLSEGSPAHVADRRFVLGQRDIHAQADRSLVGVVRRKAQADQVTQEHAREAADARVGLASNPHDCGLVIEAELLDDRAVDDDHRLQSRRRAEVACIEIRLRHRFDDTDQDRHVLGAAAGHDAVYRHRPDRRLAVLGLNHAQHLVRVAVGETQEGLDALDRRRDDRQPVGPLLLEEVLVDLVQRALEHDGARLGLDHFLRNGYRPRQLGDDIGDQDFGGITAQFFVALRHDHTGEFRDAKVGHALPPRVRSGLLEERRGDDRRTRYAGALSDHAGAHDSRRAGTTAADPRDHGVDAMFPEPLRQQRQRVLAVPGAVDVAESFGGDEPDTGIAFLHDLFDDRDHLVMPKAIV